MRWPTTLRAGHAAAEPGSHAPPAPPAADAGLGEGLRRVRAAAASEGPEDALLHAVAREVAAALRVPLCAVLELDATRRWLTVVAGVGWAPEVVGTGHIPVGPTTQAGLTLRLETPVVCDDLPRTPLFRDAVLLRHHGVVSSVSAPVGDPDAPIGVLAAHATARREFTAAETRFVARAAALLATGLRFRRLAAGMA